MIGVKEGKGNLAKLELSNHQRSEDYKPGQNISNKKIQILLRMYYVCADLNNKMKMLNLLNFLVMVTKVEFFHCDCSNGQTFCELILSNQSTATIIPLAFISQKHSLVN